MTSSIKASSSNMQNVAFVWTEFQQNILNAILLQDQRQIDVLFIRKGIGEFSNLVNSSKRVVNLHDTACSYRNSRVLRREIQTNVKPYLSKEQSVRVYSWTVDHPYVRSVIFDASCEELHLFEDGTGSYVDFGWFNHKLGVKALLSKLALHASLHEHGAFSRYPTDLPIYGWSLFPGAYPRIPTIRKELFHQEYRNSISLMDGESDSAAPQIPDGSIFYIPSPYADCNLVSDEEEVEMHSQALSLLVEDGDIAYGATIYWKPHPRANPERERERIKCIEGRSGLCVKVVEGNVGMESIALKNKNIELSFFSLASSALYGISALGIDNHRVCAVRLKELTNRFPHIVSLYDFFDKAKIRIIG